MIFERIESSDSLYVPYEKAWRYQHEILSKVIAGDREAQRVLFCEHSPVVTRGRGLQRSLSAREGDDSPRSMPLSRLPDGVSYYEVERGGDLTWHGPGQLTIYPILDVESVEGGLHGYLRGLENWVIATLEDFGLRDVHSVPGSSGVWVGEHKIASLGIACRKWVSYHGVGLNLFNDLSASAFMSPCGFTPDVMTNFYTKAIELGVVSPQISDLRAEFETRLIKNFSKIGIKSYTSSMTKFIL